MDSILNTTKKLLGLDGDYTPFDTDIIVNINAAFNTLTQLGVGPKEGYMITGAENVWDEFTTNKQILGMLQQYLYLKTKVIFDPPSTSFVADALKSQAEQMEWRMREQAEFGGEEE